MNTLSAADSQPYEPSFLGDLASHFQSLSPAAMAITFVVMIGIALWLAYKALPFYRAIRAVKTAPRVDVAIGEEGLVKVVGKAFPGQEVKDGYALPDYVWRATSKMSSTSTNMGTRTQSVGPMLLRDETGECVVDSREARVFYTSVDSSSHDFLGSYRINADYRINTGDAVFAIGVLGKAKIRPGKGELPRCTLRKSKSGVLIYSGQSEARTLFRLQARFWPMAGSAFLLAIICLWGFRANLLTYPTNPDYLKALIGQPWASIWERIPQLQEGSADQPVEQPSE